MTLASPLRILLLEDDPGDAGLIQGLLEAEGFVCAATRVQTRAEFVSALDRPDFDLILADHKLPSFDGFSALKLASTRRPDLPFIFVSGSLGEELAIDALKIGATDYVLKTRLSRLVPAVQRALREAQERAERRRAQEKLHRNQHYLSEAQRLTHTGSWTLNRAGEVYWTEETFRIWAFDPQQPVPDREKILQRVHPEDRDRVRARGTEAARDATDYVEEFRIVLPDGTVRHIQAVGRPVLDANGELIEVVGTHVDVTERKQAEHERERLRQLELDLAHMNRVGIMGELAASLAHEITQPIAAVRNNAHAALNFLDRQPSDLGEVRDALDCVVGDADRAGDIIDRVRSLYRRGTSKREPVNLNEIVRDMTSLLRDTARRNSIAIRTKLAPALPMAMADRIQLQQVLMNLMLNGIEAMKENGGELTVASARGDDDDLLISVIDCGVGLPKDKAERLFEAFFTTKPQGSGMGLSISRRIIESHGGRLWARSNPGRGATFRFTLPAT